MKSSNDLKISDEILLQVFDVAYQSFSNNS